jgi:hypothetical protein
MIRLPRKKRTDNLARLRRNQTVLGAPASRRQILAETTYVTFFRRRAGETPALPVGRPLRLLLEMIFC